jgi:DNA-binding XRE family transcriptional regulator
MGMPGLYGIARTDRHPPRMSVTLSSQSRARQAPHMVDTRPPVLIFRSPRAGASFEFWLFRKLRPATRRSVTAALVALLPREEAAVTASNRCRRHGPGLYRVRFAVRRPAGRPRAQASGHPQDPQIAVSVFFAWAGAAPVILNGHAIATNGLAALRETPGLGDARRRARELREAERGGVLRCRLGLDTLEGIKLESPGARLLRETHDPLGALVLFEHVHTMVRSEAARQGSAALAELGDAEDRYRLGAALQAHRLAAGVAQRELAIRSGIPQHRISEIENGCANPTLSTLTALTRALGAELTLGPGE